MIEMIENNYVEQSGNTSHKYNIKITCLCHTWGMQRGGKRTRQPSCKLRETIEDGFEQSYRIRTVSNKR